MTESNYIQDDKLNIVNIVPSTPDPSIVALVAMLIRYVLFGLSLLGLYHGATVSDSTLTFGASAIVSIATISWAIVDRIKMAKHTHDAAVLSVKAMRAVQPGVKP